MKKNQFPETPWSRSWEDVVSELHVSPDKGLAADDVHSRRKSYGANALRETKPVSSWVILVNQFKNLIVAFLATASVISFAFGEYVEGFAIGIVILINAVIGFFTELKGSRSVEALRKLGTVQSRVRRNGSLLEIPAEELVPGDIVVLEGGDIITADLRLITASKLESDESVLTGESLPVSKNSAETGRDAPLAERPCMLFKGTALTRGSGEAVVVGTGMNTELGKISSLVAETESGITPLEKQLNQLGHWLIWVSLAIAFFVAVSGILAGRDTFLMIETAIALAVASIPEGLPIVATIALARGVWRMARHNALIKELSAVETLGATSVICTDKTGTLTENRLTLTDIILADGDVSVHRDGRNVFVKNGAPVDPSASIPLKTALITAVLCNNASYSPKSGGEEGKSVGDPLEVALLAAASLASLNQSDLLQKMPEVREEAFDSNVKMMATYNREESGYLVSVKGAPEAVLDACVSIIHENEIRQFSEETKKEWLRHNDRLAEKGLRVLAMAVKHASDPAEKPYENLRFIGLVGFLDPPRKDVREALSLCKKAGVKVIMATGDQSVTAQTIGRQVGLVEDENAPVINGKDLKSPAHMTESEITRLLETRLFARVSPEQKLDLIEVHQKNGAIVAMTGDGVNDAPALKKADIGISMGKRGTQVAREASDMILKDDAFATIVHAIEQGRIIFNNIRKFILYLLSCNISEVMTVTLATFLSMPLPILPLQILFLNIVTDVFPALALAAGESNPGIMDAAPRKKNEPIMTRQHWLLVMVYGLTITVSVLWAGEIARENLGMDASQAVTITFLTLAFAQLWHVFNMRDHKARIFYNIITRNPFIWGALVLCTLLLVATVYLPGLSDVLKVMDPGIKGWGLVLFMSLLPVGAGFAVNALAGKAGIITAGK